MWLELPEGLDLVVAELARQPDALAVRGERVAAGDEEQLRGRIALTMKRLQRERGIRRPVAAHLEIGHQHAEQRERPDPPDLDDGPVGLLSAQHHHATHTA